MIELAFLLALATLLLFGVADALSSVPAKRLSPITITLLIDLTSFIVFGVISYWFWDSYVWSPAIWLAALTGFLVYIGFLCFVYALKTGSVGVSSAIANTYPLLVLVFGVLVLGEVIAPLQLLAIFIIMIGVFGIVTKFSWRDFSWRSLRTGSVGFAFFAMLFWTGQVIFTTYALETLPPFQVTQVMSVTALATGIVFFLGSGKRFADLRSVRRSDVYVCSSLSLLYFTGVLTLNWALTFGAIGLVSAIAGAAPLAAAIFAYLFFRERLSQAEWIAIVIVVLGLMGLGLSL